MFLFFDERGGLVVYCTVDSQDFSLPYILYSLNFFLTQEGSCTVGWYEPPQKHQATVGTGAALLSVPFTMRLPLPPRIASCGSSPPSRFDTCSAASALSRWLPAANRDVVGLHAALGREHVDGSIPFTSESARSSCRPRAQWAASLR